MEQPVQPSVLIIANRYRLAEVIAKGLRREGWTTVIALDNRDCLTLLNHPSIRWLILDLDGLDEMTLATLMQLQCRCKTPILLLASDQDRGDRIYPQFQAVLNLLIKPFRIQDILHSGPSLHLVD